MTGTPRVLFVEGDGALPRGIVPVTVAVADVVDLPGAVPVPRHSVEAREAAEVTIKRRPWVMWRLLSGNNRELGRSAMAFADLESAVAAVMMVRGGVRHLESRIVQDSRPTQWSWLMDLDDETTARSSRAYQRLRECHYSLAGFLESLPRALVLADPSRVVHQRRLHAAAVEPIEAPVLEIR
jgi:hypothetical protein